MVTPSDVICLSHLRWDSVYQRPHHLMSRFARHGRVFFVNEPQGTVQGPSLDESHPQDGLTVVTPRVSEDVSEATRDAVVQNLVAGLVTRHGIRDYALWYYTPMAIPATRRLQAGARVVVYDCMDELSAFRGAPTTLRLLEAELFEQADLVFTGGQSLYEAKRDRHPSVHAFPSSVDVPHFAQARQGLPEPPDQATVPRPRAGFYGVIDERMVLDLVAGVADALPEFNLIFLGPLAKIAPSALPVRPNIHYFGQKGYAELPAYLAG